MDLKLKSFTEAAQSFSYIAKLDLSPAATGISDPKLIDALQNGKAQKFEYACELCWEAIKAYLLQVQGIDEASPKKVIKALYLTGLVSETDYLTLIQAIDDRNQLSHVYNETVFNEIIARMRQYADLLETIVLLLDQHSQQ